MLKFLADGPFVPKEIIKIHKNKSFSVNKDKEKKIYLDKNKNEKNISNLKENYLKENKINNNTKNLKNKNLKLNEVYVNDLIKELILNNNSSYDLGKIKNNYKSKFNKNFDNSLSYYNKTNNFQTITNNKNLKLTNKYPIKIKKNNLYLSKIDNINNQNNYKENEIIIGKNFNRNISYDNIIKENNNINYPINFEQLNDKSKKINKNDTEKLIKKNRCKSFNNLLENKSKSLYNIKNNILKSKNIIKKLKKLLENFDRYDLLINNRKIVKKKLESSISDIETSIKIFKRNKKDNEKECIKLIDDNNKLIANTQINKEKVKELNSLKNDNIFMKQNIMYNALKEQTKEINKEILKEKDKINIINNYIKKINFEMIKDNLKCDKMRQDINFYIKHSNNLKETIKLFEQKTNNADYIIKEMNKKYST